ncbi:KinB-signaling pathway activation protein [Paenibacillus filicis]|uniref:KinB-signaling pathway activation protein n=1 Tax=Paenibacillus gyeongsangnamensis TaxID=3388067 RepID=A0ABT4QKG7_9BACL|nr:KinB-signaling pathway activation protein [Paenibacillus filicis]MCZ8517297.1 KinB-signaling pathway activation protein [Paenibacillus filicis]
MTIRKWFYLFWTTLLIGSAAAVIAGLMLQLSDQQLSIGGKEIGFSFITMLLGGATISVLSQMGFFAYLIVRFIMMGIIRNKVTWDSLQLLVIAYSLFDLIYLRYSGSQEATGWLSFAVLPCILVVCSLVASWWKVKLTHRSAWIPTMFFLVSVTAMEAVPALRLNNAASTIFMMSPLYLCNVWQILILTKVLKTNKEPL